MDNYDLNIITNVFCEDMAYLCQKLFPNILEEQGSLSKILLDSFYSNQFLYMDLMNENDFKDIFKSFINFKYKKINNQELYDLLKSNFKNYKYVSDADGKFYKYNYEINNVYYCPDNIIIDKGVVKQYDKEKFIIVDYFIIDLINKKIFLYDNSIEDMLINRFNSVKKIDVMYGNIIAFYLNNTGTIIIKLDEKNRIIKYFDNDIEYINSSFLRYNTVLKNIKFPNLKYILSEAFSNKKVDYIEFPDTLLVIDDYAFLNNNLKSVVIPKMVIKIGKGAFKNNDIMSAVFHENISEIKSNAFSDNPLKQIYIYKETNFAENSFDDDVIIKKLRMPHKKKK